MEHVALFRKCLPARVAIKASGGIRSFEVAQAMVAAGATRLGCSAGVAIVQQAAIEMDKSPTEGQEARAHWEPVPLSRLGSTCEPYHPSSSY